MTGSFGEGCACMMVMCALLTSQGGFERHIYSYSRRFYWDLALTSTVIVAHVRIADGGMAIRAVSGPRRKPVRANDSGGHTTHALRRYRCP
jgi:hypothetical protein